MTPTSRERLLESISETDPSGPTNPFQAGVDLDAEAGVYADMRKITNPDAWVGTDGEEGDLARLPLDLDED